MSEVAVPKIKGVIFDLDGTLYQMRWYLRPLLTIKIFPHILRLPRFLHERNKFAGLDMGSRPALMIAIGKALAIAEKADPDKMIEWIENQFYPSFLNVMPFFRDSRPKIDSTLIRLRDANMRMAVLSDYSLVKERVEKLGLNTSYFDILESSENSGALKPSPLPFLAIASQWNLSSSEIVVVGDRDDTDGAAARNAGMQFIGVCDSPSKNETFNCWDDVCSKLLSFCK